MEGIVAWVAGAAVFVGGLSLIWRRGVRPFFHFLGRVHGGFDDVAKAAPVVKALADKAPPLLKLADVSPALVKIADVSPVLVDIGEQFKPNAGGSLRDTVDRIDSTLATNTETTNRVEKAQDISHAKQIEMLGQLEGLVTGVDRVEDAQHTAERHHAEDIPHVRRTAEEQALVDEDEPAKKPPSKRK